MNFFRLSSPLNTSETLQNYLHVESFEIHNQID